MCIFPVILWVAQRSLEHCVASRGPACVELHINAPIGIGKKKTNTKQSYTCLHVSLYTSVQNSRCSRKSWKKTRTRVEEFCEHMVVYMYINTSIQICLCFVDIVTWCTQLLAWRGKFAEYVFGFLLRWLWSTCDILYFYVVLSFFNSSFFFSCVLIRNRYTLFIPLFV